MIVNISVVGDRELIARFKDMPRAVNEALYKKALSLALKLEKHIKVNKLNGAVLNRISGALSRSIHNVVTRDLVSVIARVFSSGDVKYAGIHEYGGKTSPHVIEPKKASVLAFMGKGGSMMFARKVNHPGSKMPERSFMRSSLRDMSTEISLGLKQAVVGTVQAKVKG